MASTLRPFRILLPVVLSSCLIACNGGTDAGSTPGGGNTLSFKLEGKAYTAEALSISAQVYAGGVTGTLFFLGGQSAGDVYRGVTVTLYNVTGPGEYPLGTDMSAFGGIGQVGESQGSGGDANSWITPSNGRAGKVVLTRISDGRLAGSFEYTTEAGHSNKVGGSRTVTDGKFDLAYTGNLKLAAEGKGGRVTAILNGKPYNAATVNASLLDYTGKAGINISTINSETAISLMLEGVTAPGTYELANKSPIRTLTAGRNGGTAEFCCWQSPAGTLGTITVTSITAERVKGTFTATLPPTAGKPATEDLVIEDGEFDVGVK